MRRMIESLSARSEFVIVTIIAFALPVGGSLFHLVFHYGQPSITPSQLLHLIVVEPVLLIGLAWILQQRGWTVHRLAGSASFQDPLVGVVLFIVSYLGYWLVWTVVQSIAPLIASTAAATPVVSGKFALLAVIAVSVINPIFEETFVCGYVICSLSAANAPGLAVSISVAIRLSYHLYQGAIGVMSIVPMGLVCAWWYVKRRRLWPVIIAHGLQDFASLISFT